MSTYDEKLKKVVQSLTKFIMDDITSKYEEWSGAWFEFREFYEVAEAYGKHFSKEFGPQLDESFRLKLWFAGQNVAYAIHAYVKTNPDYTSDEFIRFVNTFVSDQLGDFDNWSHEFAEDLKNAETEGEEETQDNPV